MSAQPQTHAPNLGMQPTTFANPMGINGFEFVEFAAPAGQGPKLHAFFRQMGFSATLKHKTREITVYRQGGVNFLVNEEPDGFAADFAIAKGRQIIDEQRLVTEDRHPPAVATFQHLNKPIELLTFFRVA